MAHDKGESPVQNSFYVVHAKAPSGSAVLMCWWRIGLYRGDWHAETRFPSTQGRINLHHAARQQRRCQRQVRVLGYRDRGLSRRDDSGRVLCRNHREQRYRLLHRRRVSRGNALRIAGATIIQPRRLFRSTARCGCRNQAPGTAARRPHSSGPSWLPGWMGSHRPSR